MFEDPIIKKVANGYFVYPNDERRAVTPDNEIYVFETFDALVNWLKNNLDKRREPEEPKGDK